MGPPRLMRDDKAAEVGVMAALLPLVVAAVELEAGAVEETITEVKGADVEVLVTELVVPLFVAVDVEVLLVVAMVEEVEELVEVEVPLAIEKSPVVAKTLVMLPISTASSV